MASRGAQEIHLRRLETAACGQALVHSTGASSPSGVAMSCFHEENSETCAPLRVYLAKSATWERSSRGRCPADDWISRAPGCHILLDFNATKSRFTCLWTAIFHFSLSQTTTKQSLPAELYAKLNLKTTKTNRETCLSRKT